MKKLIALAATMVLFTGCASTENAPVQNTTTTVVNTHHHKHRNTNVGQTKGVMKPQNSGAAPATINTTTSGNGVGIGM